MPRRFASIKMIRFYYAREEIVQHLIAAWEQFAQGQLLDGYRPLLVMINFLVLEEIGSTCRQVLLESGTRMHEFGPDQMEYLILAIVAMERCLK